MAGVVSLWAVFAFYAVASHAVEFHPWDRGRIGAGERVVLVAPRPYGMSPGTWRQIRGPNVTVRRVAEGATGTDRVEVFCVAPGKYQFEYENGNGKSAGIVMLTVPPGRDKEIGDRRPQVVLPAEIIGYAGEPLRLRPLKKSDPDDDPLFHAWTLIPSSRDLFKNSTLPRLFAANTPHAILLSDQPGQWRVKYVVSDGRLNSHPASSIVTIRPARDTAAPFRPADPRNRFSVSLVRGTLQDMIAMSPRYFGVTVTVGTDIGDANDFREYGISMKWNLLDRAGIFNTVSMQTGIPWRVVPGGAERALYGDVSLSENGEAAIIFQSDYEAIRGETERRSFDIRLKGVSMEEDGSDIAPLLRELFRDYRMAGKRLNWTIVQQSDGTHIRGELPRSASQRMEEAFQSIASRPAKLPPMPPPLPGISALETHLAAKIVDLQFEDLPLDAAIREWADAAGVTAVFRPRDLLGFDHAQPLPPPEQFAELLPTVHLHTGPVTTAQDALNRLSASNDLKWEYREHGIVLFWKTNPPALTRRSLFDRFSIRIYPLQEIHDRTGMSSEWIVHHVLTHIRPEYRTVPGAVFVYLDRIDALFVLQHSEAHRAVLRELHRLFRMPIPPAGERLIADPTSPRPVDSRDSEFSGN